MNQAGIALPLEDGNIDKTENLKDEVVTWNSQNDERLSWMQQRTLSAYKNMKAETFRELFRSEENLRVISEFLTTPDVRCLLFIGPKVQATATWPKGLKRESRVVYFLKLATIPVQQQQQQPQEDEKVINDDRESKSDAVEVESEVSPSSETPQYLSLGSQHVLFGEIGAEPLVQLSQIIQEVYLPLLSNNANQEGWGEVAAKEIMDKLHQFLASTSITVGQTQGRTCLPLPVADTSSTTTHQNNAVTNKDKIHVLEGAVITWTKQIKNVLKQDPEILLKMGLCPTPDMEVDFWRSKADNLNSIFNQLQGEKIRRVLRFLDTSKSTYCNPFAKLCREVFTARLEANDNVKFLSTLDPWTDKLNNSDDFPSLTTLFKPMLHLILKIWSTSNHYNTPARLVVLMREICNALINQACKYVSGQQIFDLIESDNAGEAVDKLKMTLKVCGTFKSTYFDYKAAANAEHPNNPWRIQNNALFMRLDAFLERCHDILDLTQTIVQFTKLSKIEVGGTKGKTLTTSVTQIYSDFCNAMETFQQVEYNIMDVSAKQFDDDFYEFRCRIKEMERRLGSVLTQGFDDAGTVHGRFKLLDSFEGLLERPIIQDELERKHIVLIKAFGEDVKCVQELFITQRDEPPISTNLPPAAGAIYWCNSLLDRINQPMEKLKSLNRNIMDREETKEVSRLHQSVADMLLAYRERKGNAWCESVDSTAMSKLKLPLLIHTQPNNLLEVNFDSELILLLREVKYFLLLGMDVPGFALELNKKEFQFRNWRGKLQLCVNKYNTMMTSMLPVEVPLVRSHIEKIHKVVETGLTLLTWKSHGIDNFIEKAEMAVNEAENMLSALKNNLAKVEHILDTWAEQSLFQRPHKAVAVDEFKQIHSTKISARYQQITDGGKEINRLLKDSNKTLRISAGHPEWRAYVDFVNNVVVGGLVRMARMSISFLNKQVEYSKPMQDPSEGGVNSTSSTTAEPEKSPMLQVNINLNNNQVMYIPSVLEEDRNGIRASVSGWIEDVFRIGMLIKRLDLGEGTYVRELQQDLRISLSLSEIHDNLTHNEQDCAEFQQQYDKYSFLWTTDLQTMFAQFVRKATSEPIGTTGMCKVDLQAFDNEMQRLGSIKDEVSLLRTPTTIGWLKVDSTPIKENIVHWVHKWLYLYIGFLRDDVVAKLTDLRKFIKATRINLERDVDQESSSVLLSVMGSIRDVRRRMDDTIDMLDPLKATVNLLRQHKVDVDDEILYGTESGDEEPLLAFLDSAGMKWDSLVNYSFRIKEQIMPLQNQEIESIKRRLDQFSKSVNSFHIKFKDVNEGAPFSFNGPPDEAYERLAHFESLFHEKDTESKELNRLEELFDLQPTKYRTLLQTREDLRVLKSLWDFCGLVLCTHTSWNQVAFRSIDTSEYAKTNDKLKSQLKELGGKDPSCRGYGVYRDTEKVIKEMGVVLPLIAELHSSAMRARHWKSISAACKVATIAWDHESFCFEKLLALHLQHHSDEVSEQVETAEKELKIEKKLEVIESRWETLKIDWVDVNGNPPTISQLKLLGSASTRNLTASIPAAPGDNDVSDAAISSLTSEDSRKTLADSSNGIIVSVNGTVGRELIYLPRPSDEVVDSLDADQVELQGMIGMGKFVKYFKDRVLSWAKTLSDIEGNLKDWLNVSKQWTSLETIFLDSADIRTQLPNDTKRFENIDHEFRALERRAFGKSPLVVNRCTEEGLRDVLKKMLQDLAKCQKALTEYLDTKKKIFPRFYFVSNEALLDILSHGTIPKRIVPYLTECYDSINDLEFVRPDSENPTVATAMIARDGEKVPFVRPFEMKGAVEIWLSQLTDTQVFALKNIIRTAIDTAFNWEHDKPRHEWLIDYPAQAVLVAAKILWTEETEAALEELEGGNEDAVKHYLTICNTRLHALIQLVEGNLSKQDRTKVIALITMDVHSRDVVQKLIDEKAEGPLSFLWQQQLRNYWPSVNPGMQTEMKVCDFRTKYSYEYCGNVSRLVITPLTDRCYITLTTAMRLMLGGAPAGPAGTGKTETTKDLARALGLPCYVFNCSDQMNYQTLGEIFKGLSQTGAWGCFDEFNRIPVEVLSVVATQVKLVLDAKVLFSDPAQRPVELREAAGELGNMHGTPPCKVGSFDFFGDELCLIPTVGLFITMNPGYAGRTNLPENLKALFRSCAMIRPDLALICENMLMAEGFQRARSLSVKFVTLYQLSAQLLSSQAHYDWGLRAVKSVLAIAGKLKRDNLEMDEEPVLMRALRDCNAPKIPANDLPIFLRLITDLFPKYADSTPTVIDEDLREVAIDVCTKSSPTPLQPDVSFLNKIVQFKQLLDVRHSVVLIGCAGSGKTTVWRTLLGCNNEIGRKNLGASKDVAVAETFEPKALTTDELYGHMSLSKDWKDGALSICMRGMSKNNRDLGYHEYQTSKWVVLDGDIDAEWIESMNTVMDDNKVLTLVSNERIPLSDSMRMIFEIDSLKNATPATVSRAGILYINECDIGWRPFVDSWLATLDNVEAASRIMHYFETYVEPILEFEKTARWKQVTPIYVINQIQTTVTLLQAHLPVWTRHGSEDQELLEQYFLYCCAWGIGGSLVDDKNVKHRSQFGEKLLSLASPVLTKSIKDGCIFNYFVDPTIKDKAQRWVHWEERVEEYTPATIGHESGQTPFSSLYVSTVDNVRITYLLSQLVPQERPVMLAGNTGTGKTRLIQTYLRELVRSDESTLMTTISMNYFMDATALQLQIEGAVDKRSGRRFGPPGNKKLVYFLDDVNLPFVETYGTQNSIALLRQLMTYESCFDRQDLGFKKEIVGVRFIAAMNPTAGSFAIAERAQVRFSTFACMMPDEEGLRAMFVPILVGHLYSFSQVDDMADSLVGATLGVYKRVSEKFLPSAAKVVYSWSMRDLAGVLQGVCLSSPRNFDTSLAISRLWLHECRRVFGDRLVDDTDRSRFDDIIADVSKTFSLDEFEKLHKEPLMFTSFKNDLGHSSIEHQGGDDNVRNNGNNAVGQRHQTRNGSISSGGSNGFQLGSSRTGAGGDEGGADNGGGSPYHAVKSDESLRCALDDHLMRYNEENAEMNLVLFDDAARHLTRIARIIGSARTNALLVGVGGSGKQSLARLAAYICECDIAQFEVTPEFTTAMLIEKLQDLFKATGIRGIPTVWIVNDSQIINEQFLVYINDILSNGWIPDLFPREELPGILDGLKAELRANGLSDTYQDKVDLFVQRVRRCLHVVLCFSPVGKDFRTRARRFPGLINSSVIDWFHPWPEDALVSVAARFLGDVSFCNDETKENVAYHMATVHLEVKKLSVKYLQTERRWNYVTPKTFLEFITFYKSHLQGQRDKVGAQVQRLQNGLNVLQKTSDKVADLQQDLKVTMANVAEKKAASEILMEQIGVQRAEAEQKKELAAQEAANAFQSAEEASEIEEEAQEDLRRAKPAMDAAEDAVKCLSKASIIELKSLSKPPAGISLVTKCCLMMIDQEFKNFKWDRAKKMMMNVDKFLGALLAFDARTMSEELVKRIEPVVNDPEFTYENMIKKSQAAANLCNWVINIHKYNRIYVEVKPKMDRLAAAQAEKGVAEAKVEEVYKVVQDVEKRLADLKATFLKATEEKMAVEALALQCETKLDLANRLVTGLASERNRWAIDVESLRYSESNLVGTVLVSSAFVGYIGGFDSAHRKLLWKESWLRDIVERELPIGNGETIDPLSTLITDSQRAHMNDEGLPSDRISVENGAIITCTTRWPLVIDPQEQGIRWLKCRFLESLTDESTSNTTNSESAGKDGDVAEGENSTNASGGARRGSNSSVRKGAGSRDNKSKAIVTQLSKKDWELDVARAIEEGLVVLIENVGQEINSTLGPVLARQIVRKGRNKFMNFAGKELEYDPRFRMFLFTKLANPHYQPEVQAQCTLVNFIATETGLQDQLLARVVRAERPEKEMEQEQLKREANHFKIQLVKLEDDLLVKLAAAPDDILSDVPLIESLENTKQNAEKISEAVEAGERVLAEIAKIRGSYESVASEAATLYFLLTKLGMINHMYQYSLDAFIQFFDQAIGMAALSKIVKERTENLRSSIRFTIFKWVSRGLIEEHKIIFLSQLTFALLRKGELVLNTASVTGENSGGGGDSGANGGGGGGGGNWMSKGGGGGGAMTTEWNAEAFSFLVAGPNTSAAPSPNVVDEWLSDTAWNAIIALSKLDEFMNLPNDLVEAAPRFRDWLNTQEPESEKLPLEWAQLDRSPLLKLLVVRCLRPDRMTIAMEKCVRRLLPHGDAYVNCDSTHSSFDVLRDVFDDSKPTVPIYFVLSAGVDVTSDMDKLVKAFNMENGKSYFNVSMGQGQDRVAERFIENANLKGHWVLLNNVHLMPNWLIHLEKMLDAMKESGTGHSDFRLFLSSDQSERIPIGLLARSIKLANEAPSGLKANLTRAFCSFPKATLDDADTKTRGILFGLCYFHSVVMERKKFGPMGFNMAYPFSLGDLRDSFTCLNNYMDSSAGGTPWDDLKYIFGEIIYGGHIVDDFDRLLVKTYLDFYMKDDLLDEMELYPYVSDDSSGSNGHNSGGGGMSHAHHRDNLSFKSPMPTTYEHYLRHINDGVQSSSPLAFGMHPNAEIGFRTDQSQKLFSTLQELEPRLVCLDGQDESGTPHLAAENATNDILDRFGEIRLDTAAVRATGSDDTGPLQHVFLQECDSVNVLLEEMSRSMEELTLGFAGEFTISETMDRLTVNLYQGTVPADWVKLSWPSMRNLPMWLQDLSARISQLQEWLASPNEIPRVTWIAGLVNPNSFLTAIKQIQAQRSGAELDKLVIHTEITKKVLVDDIDGPPREGAYICGLSMQGARWDVDSGMVEPSRPKEMFSPMPVINCRAIKADKLDALNVFHCPCYKTTQRGATFVFSAQLRTKAVAARWVLASVALIMDVGE